MDLAHQLSVPASELDLGFDAMQAGTEPEADAGPGSGSGSEPAGSRAPSGAHDRFGSLDDRSRRILEFEKQWWRHAGAKEAAVRAEFGLSTTRYQQLLNMLIDSQDALVAEPMLVRRLRRLRAARREARDRRAGRADLAEE